MSRVSRPPRRRRKRIGNFGRALLAAGAAGTLAAGCAGDPPAPPATPGTAAPRPAETAAPATDPPPTTPAPDACVEETLRGLPLERRAGQLLLVGVPAGSPGDGAASVAREHVAGVFLTGRTTISPARLRQRLDELQDDVPGPPLLVAVDQEGGKVRTLRGAGFTEAPPAADQADWPVARVRSAAGRAARELAAAGVNLDLAPVADTVPPGTERRNPPIGVPGRHYGGDPAEVAERVAAVAAELSRHRVVPTVKHFPGLGRVRVNTDAGDGAVDRRTTADDPYLEPFEAGIEAGAAVMMSSALYPELDPDRPAVFSPDVVDGLLRDRLGFRGLVLSDDLGRAKAVAGVAVGQRAVRFVTAGGDLALTVRTEDARPMRQALVERAERDAGFRDRVEESARRVLTVKRSAGLLTCTEEG